MNSDLEKTLVAALVGLAAWLVKDVAFSLIQRINDTERREWEYRLKEVYCPLYFWSGLMAMRLDNKRRYEVCERLEEVMARAAYVIPRSFYYTIVRLIESAYGQPTRPATEDERNGMREYLYDQIEALNLLLYRSEFAGGAGDPAAALSPQRRLARLLLLGLGHLVTWMLALVIIGGAVWLYQRRYFDLLGGFALLLLILLMMYVRRRREVRKGLEQRIRGGRQQSSRPLTAELKSPLADPKR